MGRSDDRRLRFLSLGGERRNRFQDAFRRRRRLRGGFGSAVGCGLRLVRAYGRRRRFGLGGGLGLGLPLEAATVGQPPDAIGRRLVDARRVALHADLELVRELDDKVVVDAELSSQLIDPDLLRGQTLFRSLENLAG
jgi:hypothetical protein